MVTKKDDDAVVADDTQAVADDTTAAPAEPTAQPASDVSAGGTSDKFGRTLYTATCAECGAETQVPFKPAGDRPVYCRDCYMKRRKSQSNRRF